MHSRRASSTHPCNHRQHESRRGECRQRHFGHVDDWLDAHIGRRDDNRRNGTLKDATPSDCASNFAKANCSAASGAHAKSNESYDFGGWYDEHVAIRNGFAINRVYIGNINNLSQSFLYQVD
jgi:hypothetical protein